MTVVYKKGSRTSHSVRIWICIDVDFGKGSIYPNPREEGGHPSGHHPAAPPFGTSPLRGLWLTLADPIWANPFLSSQFGPIQFWPIHFCVAVCFWTLTCPPDRPPLNRPKFRSFCSLSRHIFHSFCLSLGVFSWNFGGVLPGP